MSVLFSIISFVSNVLVFIGRDLWLCAKYFLQTSLRNQILLTFTTLMITLYLKNENPKPVLRYELHTHTEV